MKRDIAYPYNLCIEIIKAHIQKEKGKTLDK